MFLAHLRRLLLCVPLMLAACTTLQPAEPGPTAGASASAPGLGRPEAAAAAGRAPSPAAALPTPSVTGVAVAVVAPPSAAPLVTVDPLQPSVQIDLDAPTARTDLWLRVRRGVAIPDLDGELVTKWEQWYASRPDHVLRMTERGGRYLFHIVEELNKRGMPTELALLPFIESAFNPQAMSTAKASGMWQFIPGTGRDFDLKQNVFRDDRRDVLASTRAALDYLHKLHGMFGDWQLALAAYNWGQGSVQRAIARNQKLGLATDYSSLRMPDETRNYLPKLQAVENIVARPEAFGLSLPKLGNHPGFVSVGLTADIDLDRAARLAGVPLEEFKQLNPQMNKPVILAAGTPQVLLPYDNANRFVHALRSHFGPLASWTAWIAPRTMKPADVARLVGMDEAQLRTLNNIPPRMLVKAGSTLLVPRDALRGIDVSEKVADNAALSLAPDRPPYKMLRFKAGKRGDSVAAVAKRYRSTAAQVAQWNDTRAGASFKPGQTIVVQVAQSAAKASRAAAATGGKRQSKPAPTARSRAPRN